MNEKIFYDFSAVCAKFSDAVKENKYKKVDYCIWRSWYRTLDLVTLSYNDSGGKQIYITNGSKIDILPINDNSFGEFLYNEYFNEEGTKAMMSAHTITDKKIEELATQVANLKNEELAKLAVSATKSADAIAVKPGDYLSLDDSLAFEAKITPSVATIGGYEIATVDNVSTKADKSDVAALDVKVDEMISRIDKLETQAAVSTLKPIEDVLLDCGVSAVGLDGRLRATHDVLNDLSNVYNNRLNNKEKKEMKNFNFDFGKVMDSQARVSMYGIAVKSPSGTWVAYDKKAEQMMDVDILNFEGMDMLYKMPVALNQVAAGDVIIHMGKPCFVVSFNEEGKSFNVIDIFNAEEKCILPPRSPFGFSFVTKIVSLIGDFSGSATEDSPFGNLWMYMMMKDDNDKKDLLPMMLMMGQNAGTHNIMNNPLALMMLMKNNDNKDNDIFSYLMMASMWPPQDKNN